MSISYKGTKHCITNKCSALAIILNIETATEICSICISREEEILARRATDESFQHAARITLLIQECAREAGLRLSEIDAIAVSRGPGSYTALRIGLSVAKGIAYALDKPIIAVDTLQSLALATAQVAGKEALYYPMIDARRMEVYTAPFDRTGQPLGEPEARIITEDSFRAEIEAGRRVILSGNGASKCKSVLQYPQIEFVPLLNDSAHLIPLARRAFRERDFVDIAYFTPFYLKSPNITIPRKRL